jgi:ADP-ribosylglycohydrolase
MKDSNRDKTNNQGNRSGGRGLLSGADGELEQNAHMRKLFRGCLIGGAVGDALGAPVEFMSYDQIVREFGPEGIKDYVPAYGRLGAITDDTQMTLFTAEGMLRAYVRGCMRGLSTYEGVTDSAYQRWLLTQGEKSLNNDIFRDGWLWKRKALHSRRAPGLTCLAAMKSKKKFGEKAINNSKGCGGVMRVAPVGMYAWSERDDQSVAEKFFDVGCNLAGLTHGHPTGKLTAGVFAVLVLKLLQGEAFDFALREIRGMLASHRDHEETTEAIVLAISLADSSIEPGPEQIAKMGQGWVAEEALAISIYCALVAKDFENGVRLAVNHSGDSDSTGAITGNLLGAMWGVDAIPKRWKKSLELATVITSMADDLLDYRSWDICEYYPGNDDRGKDNKRIELRYPGV